MHRRSFLRGTGLVIASPALPLLAASSAPNKEGVIRFGHLSDIHVKPGIIPETGMAKALQHCQKYKPEVEFIINGGDAIMDALAADKATTAEQFQLYKSLLKKENSLPVYNTIGNHDVWGWFVKNDENIKQDKLYGKQWVVEEFEMAGRYYSFTRGRWKFIVLDSTQLNPAGGYIGLVDEPQMQWLEKELASTPANTFICMVSHIPILSISAGLFFNKNEPNGDWKIQRNLMHTDFLVLKKLFNQYPNVRCCISGHIHLQDKINYLGVEYYCNGAVSGNWWKGSFQEFAPAYAVMELFPDGSSRRTMVNYE